MLKKIAIVQTVFLVLSFCSLTQAEVKVGYINIQKVLKNTNAGKKAKKKLEVEFNKRKKILGKAELLLKTMSEEIKKKKLVLSKAAYYKKLEAFEKARFKYQQTLQKNQLEIQAKERNLTAPILKRLQKIIAQVAKDKNYTMILEQSEQGVLWGKKELNLTDLVVKRFNEQ